MKLKSEIMMAGTLEEIVSKIKTLPGPIAILEVGLLGYSWPKDAARTDSTIQGELSAAIERQFADVIWKSESHFYGKCTGVVSSTEPVLWRHVNDPEYTMSAREALEEADLLVILMGEYDASFPKKRHEVVQALRKAGAKSVVEVCITYSGDDFPSASDLVANASLRSHPPTPDGVEMLVLLEDAYD